MAAEHTSPESFPPSHLGLDTSLELNYSYPGPTGKSLITVCPSLMSPLRRVSLFLLPVYDQTLLPQFSSQAVTLPASGEPVLEDAREAMPAAVAVIQLLPKGQMSPDLEKSQLGP